jgi:hypothetical protein
MTIRRRRASSTDGCRRTAHFYLARTPHLVATSIVVVVVFVVVASSGGACRIPTVAHALFVPPPSSHPPPSRIGDVGSFSSSLISAGASAARRRRSSSTTSLHYRSSPDDVDDDELDIGRYYRQWFAGASSYLEGPEEGGGGENILEDIDTDIGIGIDDPLSRELRHGHFPDAVMTALTTAILPNIRFPMSWIRASEAMENIVGGAGGAGLFLHLNEAARAYDGDADDASDAPPPPRRRPSSPSAKEKTTTTTFADGLAETAKAFVPVVVEFAAVAAITNYFD